ncbi:MAG: glycosyltransferase family 4 protein [Alphaproteobacteria bacterium]|nr:glycosyltransferase family 4 protein [Alphaproteobacteria bacterium]
MKSVINAACFIIPFPSIRRPLRQKLKKMWHDYKNNLDDFSKNLSGRPIVVWFDHALGGGTEVYSKKQFKKIDALFDVLRIQYFPATRLYHLTMANNKHKIYTTSNIDDMYDFLCNANIREIVVNNLVAYKNTLDVLLFIKQIKDAHKNKPHVSFRGHDFQCICPSFNLINCDGEYCQLKYRHGCEMCWKNKKMAKNQTANKVLRSGANNIQDWRNKWGNFLAQTADDIVVFSSVVSEIFTKVYPQIKNKIKIIPHEVQQYRHVNIKPHKSCNIAVLGAISQQKGADVIKTMAEKIGQYNNDVKIIVVGTIVHKLKNISVTGAYKPKYLPKIMEKNNIDIVLIPSIWPETFSYTTSEAMSMGLAVACFDIGAPAERVKNYEYGLVLEKIDPEKNIGQIIEFVKKVKEMKK